MRFGMPVLIEKETLNEQAALCRELGLDFVELNANLPVYQQIDAPLFRAIARLYGVGYTLHLDDSMDVCDFNPKVAQAYRQTVLEAIDAARETEIPLLNMHLSRGAYFTLPERKIFLIEKYRDAYLGGMERFRDACTARIGQSGVRIAVENTAGYLPVQLEALDVLLASDAFCLNYDVGHNACTGGGDEAAILDRRQRLYHMHLHDADPAKHQDHMALGTGELDIARLLGLMEANPASGVVIEVKTEKALRESVQWLRAQGLMPDRENDKG